MSAEPVYTLDILRLAASLPVESSLAEPHGRAEKRSATCGSLIATEVRLDEGRVGAVGQKVQACAFGQASAALLGRHAVGRSPVEMVAARVALRNWLRGAGEPPAGFEVLGPARGKAGRHGAILLPFDALIAALDDAAIRHSREGGSPAPVGSAGGEVREMVSRLGGNDGEGSMASP